MATCDRELKRRLRKIPGVPILGISQHKYIPVVPGADNAVSTSRYAVERLPEAYGMLGVGGSMKAK